LIPEDSYAHRLGLWLTSPRSNIRGGRRLIVRHDDEILVERINSSPIRIGQTVRNGDFS
jgi:hypothetical protein